MKELPSKWKELIRKMVEYAQKSNKLKLELEEFLNKPEFKCEEYDSNMFEDSIIDAMQYTGDWQDLINEIEDQMNGIRNDKIETSMEKRIQSNKKRI